MKVPVPYDSKNTSLEWKSFLNHYNQLIAYIIQNNELEFNKIEKRLKRLEKIIEGD